MLRPGFVLGVSGPAAILTLLVLPMVRQGADAVAAPAAPRAAAEAPASSPLPGFRPYDLAIRPVHVATAPRPETRSLPAAPTRALEETVPAKPKRLTREGCETPISSLAGPEARRMVPGRCMA